MRIMRNYAPPNNRTGLYQLIINAKQAQELSSSNGATITVGNARYKVLGVDSIVTGKYDFND